MEIFYPNPSTTFGVILLTDTHSDSKDSIIRPLSRIKSAVLGQWHDTHCGGCCSGWWSDGWCWSSW